MTVIAFMLSVYSVISSYQAGLVEGLTFFGFASLAALSFAVTWLIAFYASAAGTVYVGAKVIAANLRLESGQRGVRRESVAYNR